MKTAAAGWGNSTKVRWPAGAPGATLVWEERSDVIAFVNDSLLLVLVGIINFSGAILLAHIRTQDDTLPLPPLPLPPQHVQAEGARG